MLPRRVVSAGCRRARPVAREPPPRACAPPPRAGRGPRPSSSEIRRAHSRSAPRRRRHLEEDQGDERRTPHRQRIVPRKKPEGGVAGGRHATYCSPGAATRLSTKRGGRAANGQPGLPTPRTGPRCRRDHDVQARRVAKLRDLVPSTVARQSPSRSVARRPSTSRRRRSSAACSGPITSSVVAERGQVGARDDGARALHRRQDVARRAGRRALTTICGARRPGPPPCCRRRRSRARRRAAPRGSPPRARRLQ